MDCELVLSNKLAQATADIQRGGDGVRDGVALLLESKLEYVEGGGTGGVNCSQLLATALRRLFDDPYLTLGIPVSATPADAKKAYRKLALKFHPDKNRATAGLFQAIQGANDVLGDEEKRKVYDQRRKQQQDALDKLRKQQGAGKPSSTPSAATPATSPNPASSPPSNHPGGAGGGAAKEGSKVPDFGNTAWTNNNQSSHSDEKVKQFNKKFYDEYRKAAKKANTGGNAAAAAANKKEKAAQDPAAAGGAGSTPETPTGASSSSGKPTAPPRPRLRSTARSDSTVTLEWSCGKLPVTTAYELQWRQRGRTASDWVTSPTLIVGSSCRKKNLQQCTCYEFRIRAASAWGWSVYSDPVMVVTLSGHGTEGTTSDASSRPGSNSNSGPAADLNEARAQVQEARRQREQARKAGQQQQAQSQYQQEVPGSSGDRNSNISKTNSWYWRRMSHAVASEKGAGRKEGEGSEGKKERRNTTHQTSTASESWHCCVCKRLNEGDTQSCWVCYTSRSYQAANLEKIRIPEPGSAAGRDSTASNDPTAPAPVFPDINSRPSVKRSSTTAADGSSGSPKAKPRTSSSVKDDSTGTKLPSAAGASPRQPTTEQTQTSTSSSGSKGVSAGGLDPGIRVYVDTDDGKQPVASTEGDAPNANSTPGVWAFSDSDVDEPSECGSSSAMSDDEDENEWSYNEESGGVADTIHPHFFLNSGVTKLHNVREEPIKGSNVVGMLVAGRSVNVLAEVGEWCKVICHQLPAAKGKEKDKTVVPVEAPPDLSGWCLMKDDKRTYIIKEVPMEEQSTAEETPGGGMGSPGGGGMGSPRVSSVPSSVGVETVLEEEEEIWYELRDEDGAVYYFNSVSGASQWEQPEWMDEIDPESGAIYYVSTRTGEAQWEKPSNFVTVVRENPFYSTPEAEFAKSVLSPKRSKGACSFKEHLGRTSVRMGATGTVYRMQMETHTEEKEGEKQRRKSKDRRASKDKTGAACKVDFGATNV